MQEAADCLFLIQAFVLGERENVDTAQLPIAAVCNQSLNDSNNRGVG
jgi:hypothetical protein